MASVMSGGVALYINESNEPLSKTTRLTQFIRNRLLREADIPKDYQYDPT